MGRGSTIRVLGEIPNYVHVKEYVFVCICVCVQIRLGPWRNP